MNVADGVCGDGNAFRIEVAVAVVVPVSVCVVPEPTDVKLIAVPAEAFAEEVASLIVLAST
jgi:hypothetical protein